MAKTAKADPRITEIIERMAVHPVADVLRVFQAEEGSLKESSLKALATDRMISLSRLYGIAASWPDFRFEAENESRRPASEPVALPDFLADAREGGSAVIAGGRLAARFESPAASLAEYEAAGGMKGIRRATAMKPEQVLSEVVLGELTRKAADWQAVAGAAEAPVIIANCASGDPAAGQASRLLQQDGWAVVEGMFIAAQALGAAKGFIYLDKADSSLEPGLSAAADAIRAESGSVQFDIEVFVAPESLTASDDSVAVAAIDGRRPIPAARREDAAVSGIWGRPTLVDSAECFAAIADTLGSGERVATRLYKLSGAVSGIVEADPQASVADLLESAGAEAASGVLVGGLSGTLVGGSELGRSLASLEREDAPRWRTIHVWPAGEDIAAAVRGMAAYNARYLCGGCIPCRVGAVRMKEMLEKGDGESKTLAELAGGVERVGLCNTGRGAAGLVRSYLSS